MNMNEIKSRFTVEFTSELIINQPSQKVYALFVGDQGIGFISVLALLNEKTVTPFTAAGELKEAHCEVCAAAALFGKHSNLSENQITGVEVKKPFKEGIELSPQQAISLITSLVQLKKTCH